MKNTNKKSNIEKTPMKGRNSRKTGNSRNLPAIFFGMEPFFRAYFIVIFVLLFIQLPNLRTQSFSSWAFGGSGDAVYEINDKQDAEMLVTVGEDHLSGATVYGYLNELNLLFTDEKMIMTVMDAGTGETLTESVFLVKDQPTSSLDDTGMYFPFQDEIPKGTDVRIHLHSEGFSNRGIFFELSDEALHDNVTILDGEVSEQTLCLSFKHKNYGINLLNPLLFFLIEAALGIVLMILYRKCGFPIRIKKEKEAIFVRRRDFSPVSIAVVMAVTLLCMILLAEFTNWTAVSRVRSRFDMDMVCTDDYQLSTRIAVTDDTVVKQVIHTDKRNFRGIGLIVQNNSDNEEGTLIPFYISEKEKQRLKYSSDKVKYVKGTLVVQVYDEQTGQCLADNEYEVQYLMSVSRVCVPGVKSAMAKAYKDEYVWLDFGRNIEESEGSDYRIVISGKDTGEQGIRLSTSHRTNTTLLLDGETKQASLCMVTLFDNSSSVSIWYFLIIAGMIISVLGIGIMIRLFEVRIEYVFLVSALCMGILFSMIVPPYCVPDERTHVDTLYRISNDFLGIKEIPGPNRIYKRACDIDSEIKNTMELSPYMYCELQEDIFGAAGPDSELVPAYARNALDNVTILNYVPGAVGFTLGRLLGRNLLTMIMMARWVNIVVVSWIMFLAIRKAPYGKQLFALIGLLPKMLNQNCSTSYDGMINAVVFLFLAYTLHLFFDEEISVPDLLTVILSAWFLAANKGGAYVPLIGLLLLIPFIRKNKKRTWSRIAFYSCVSVVMVYSFKFVVRITGLLSRSSGSAVKSEGRSTLYTMSDLISDPGNLIRLFEKTAIVNGHTLFGDMFGIKIAQRELNGHWLIIIALFTLLLIASFIKDGEEVHFSIPQRLYIMLIVFAGVGLISVSMLLSWTEIGSEVIEGLQGRYFLPYLIIPFLCLQNRQIVREDTEDQTLIWFADIMLFIVFCSLIIATFSCSVIPVVTA